MLITTQMKWMKTEWSQICQHYNIHCLNSLAKRSKPDVFGVEKITYSLFCAKLFAIVQLDNALKP